MAKKKLKIIVTSDMIELVPTPKYDRVNGLTVIYETEFTLKGGKNPVTELGTNLHAGQSKYLLPTKEDIGPSKLIGIKILWEKDLL